MSSLERSEISTLRLGDMVCIDPYQPYLWATVTDIDDTLVIVRRPYLTHTEFATGEHNRHVIPYIGMERVAFNKCDTRLHWVVRYHKEIK